MGFRRGVAFVCWLAVSTLAFAATATATTPRASVTYKTARIKAAGISLQYPGTWTVLPTNKKALAALEKKLAKKNPKLALSASQQADFLKSSKFEAQGSGVAFVGPFVGNVTVADFPGGGFPSSLDEFTSGSKQALESKGATVLNTSAVRVSGRTAYRVDSRLSATLPDGTTFTDRGGQLLVAHGDGYVVVDVSTSDDDSGAKLIDRILASVRRI